jgi:hypothetical protein
MKKKNLEKALLFVFIEQKVVGRWSRGEQKVLELYVRIYKKIRMVFRSSEKELEMLEKQ